MEERLREAREEARGLESSVGGVLAEIEGLDREIDTRRLAADRIARRLRGVRERAEATRKRLASLDRELATRRQRLLERAAALVRLSRRGLGPILFRPLGASGDVARRQRALRTVLEHDRELLAGTRAARAAVETAREAAEAAARDLAQSRREHEAELARLEKMREEKQTRLAALRSEGEERELLVEELEKAATRLREMLRDEERLPAPETAGVFGSPLDDMTPGAVPSRNGVEIAASEGAPVRAVAPGRVVFASWFPGYGKMVIVDHGGHLHSIYGYAETILVRRGAMVRRGETIARAGRTGIANGARLYFEMREKGVPRPPGAYVPALGRVSN